MDWRFEILNNREFDRFIFIDTKLISIEIQIVFLDIQKDSNEFRQKLLEGSIDTDLLFNGAGYQILLNAIENTCAN